MGISPTNKGEGTVRGPMVTQVKKVASHVIAVEESDDRFFDTDDLIVVDEKAFDRNEKRAYNADLEPCYLCGKGVAEGKGWEVRGYGSRSYLIAVSEWDKLSEKDLKADMGIGKVGPECGKKIPAPFKRKEV